MDYLYNNFQLKLQDVSCSRLMCCLQHYIWDIPVWIRRWSWKTSYRGKILIHAGSSLEKDVVERFKGYNLDYELGSIIGEAEIVDCNLVDKEFNEELRQINPVVYAKSNHTETYAWKLQNIKKYDNPIPAKGKLSLWNYEDKDK